MPQLTLLLIYSNPSASILKSEAIKDSAAPVVASFSSRGPNFVVKNIMKPDITAPGVSILAASIPVNPLVPGDQRQGKYNILSGTSMSCPHAAGVAAYIKTFHPDWSPSAIKSAIMTTASPLNAATNPDGEFAYGSGHINPVKAVDPGLVYDAFKEDYIKLLCSIYDAGIVRQFTGDNSSCSTEADKVLPTDLNYPSLTVEVPAQQSFTIGFHRTVTNVGVANSVYRAQIPTNSKLNIKVVPDVLSFKSLNEKQSFDVTVTGGGLADRTRESASLVWSDGSHSVTSPIVVHTVTL